MRIYTELGITMMDLRWILCCLVCCITTSGCHSVGPDPDAAVASSVRPAVRVKGGQLPIESAPVGSSASLETASAPSSSAESAECPAQLLAYAADVLGAPVERVFPCMVERSPKRLYRVYAKTGMGGLVRNSGLFMEREGRYVRLDSRAELIGINELLYGYRFTRQDFHDSHAVFQFFGDIATFQGVKRCIPGCGYALEMMTMRDTGLSQWLRGTETDESVIKELCRDPDFAFEGNRWEVRFNLFMPDGRVDQWHVIRRHDPEANANEILRIDVATTKPSGTFSYPLIG